MTNYLPVTDLTIGSADQLQLGSLAFFTRDQTWMLGAEIENTPKLISLTGERGPTIYSRSAFGGEAVMIAPAWRIEAGGPPYLNGAYNARIGHAFRSSNGAGFYAAWAGERIMQQPLPFLSTGRYIEFDRDEQVVSMPRWRIVVGRVEAPFVIAEFNVGSDTAAGD